MSQEITDPPASPSPPSKLSALQEQAIAALLTAPSHAAAAQKLAISENTLWRYLRQPEFQQAYRQARRESISQATAQLQRLSADAVNALGAVAADEAASPSARITAARAILEMGLRAMELEDVSARIEALEEANRVLQT